MMNFYNLMKDFASMHGEENGTALMWDLVEKTSNYLDKMTKMYPETKDDYRVFVYKLKGELNNGHFDKETAMDAVSHMIPTILIMDDKIVSTKDMNEYMEAMKLTPETVTSAINVAHNEATNALNARGVKADMIPSEVNEWDKYVTMAMVIADNPLSVSGDMHKGAMLAYEFLADKDGSPRKIWDYIMK